MAIRTQYSCPRCGKVISAYSKKGYESLHSRVGIPYLECVKCGGLIATGHKPMKVMTPKEIRFEWIRTILNLIIYSIIFGAMIGGAFGGIVASIFSLSKYFVVTCGALGIPILFGFMLRRRLKWISKTDEYTTANGDRIKSDEYFHPDW
jgi:hypothetical protein